jgi:hypothetical protein
MRTRTGGRGPCTDVTIRIGVKIDAFEDGHEIQDRTGSEEGDGTFSPMTKTMKDGQSRCKHHELRPSCVYTNRTLKQREAAVAHAT